MFRKLRRPTPNFKIPPPYNPISGEHNDLKIDGVYPYCSMMQIAEEDKYDNHVICRGFDTRHLKFIDYEEGNSEKPGISVAKPFGSRKDAGEGSPKRFRVGEIFPAFLPTQGSADIAAHYVPPTPVEVKWRLGQNPGVVEDASQDGGQPEDLDVAVTLLYDHNDKLINWMMIHSDMSRHFRFQSQETLVGTSCEACVRQMTGDDPHIATIHDPDEIFSGMEEGTKGLVFFQDGKYYIVQAKCEPDELVDCE